MRATLSSKILFALSLGAALAAPARAEQFSAKVIAVIDGDTLSVMHDNTKERVILFGVDCPEADQEFGAQAKQFTDQCCFNKVITIDVKDRDKFGRTVGEILLSDGADLNQELVKRGLAWWSDKYAPNDATLKGLHEQARAQKIGLWASQNPIPPWIYRNGEKGVKATVISH